MLYRYILLCVCAEASIRAPHGHYRIAAVAMFSKLSSSRPFFLFAGPNVIETREHALRMAHAIKAVAEDLDLTYVFKASFDKANRTSRSSYRGPGLEAGLRVLDDIKKLVGVPIVTDVHEPSQAAPVAEVADILQIPAFLCRQTDLIVAAAQTQAVLHVKKGQWCDSSVVAAAADKARAAGNAQFIACERGTQFGYTDLVVDPRNLHWMRSAGGLVSADVTHSLQQPGLRIGEGGERSAGGLRELIPTVARAACAAGVDGLFMEVHDDPTNSLCDAPTQWPLRNLRQLLEECKDVALASRWRQTYELDLTPMTADEFVRFVEDGGRHLGSGNGVGGSVQGGGRRSAATRSTSSSPSTLSSKRRLEELGGGVRAERVPGSADDAPLFQTVATLGGQRLERRVAGCRSVEDAEQHVAASLLESVFGDDY